MPHSAQIAVAVSPPAARSSSVGALASLAGGDSTSSVLTALTTGSDYLEPITDDARAASAGPSDRRVLQPGVALAIISYRVAKSSEDTFTLAPAAFETALHCAARHGVTA